MLTLVLRPLQEALIEKIAEAFRAGHKNIMISAPCGFGKTEVAVALMAKTYDNNKRASFICDRIALVDQTSARFEKYKLDHGVVQANHWRFRPSQLLQVCSIQTLIRRRWPEVSLMVCDEAHVLPIALREQLLKRQCYTIGLSATPVTPGLGKFFDIVINAATTNQLIADGWLVPYDIWAASEPDMDGVKVIAGEWEEKESSRRALQVVGDCVAEYLKHGAGRKFIAFAVDVAHAREIARQFCEAGIIAVTYTYLDSDDEREKTLTEFRKTNSQIRGVISIESLTRGFDVADIGVLILARPLRKSLAVHLQMIGRVMRTAEGKERATILDHSGNCVRFWDEMHEFFENGVPELDDGKPKPKQKKAANDEDKFVKCQQCKHVHLPAPRCPMCGHEHPKRNRVQHVDGSLKELVARGDRQRLQADIWPQVCAYARLRKGPTEDGKKMARAIYHDMTNEWAKGDFFDTPDAPISREVLNWITSSNIRYRAKMRKQQAA